MYVNLDNFVKDTIDTYILSVSSHKYCSSLSVSHAHARARTHTHTHSLARALFLHYFLSLSA